MKREFNDARNLGLEGGEIPIGNWFERKRRVLRAYEFAGLGHAPVLVGPEVLVGRRLQRHLVMPDLLVFGRKQTYWIETKWKESANFTKLTQTDQTGIDARLWDHYAALLKETRMEVFLMFAHEKENVVTMDAMTRIGGRARFSEASRGMPEMLWWTLDRLTRVASLSDLLEGKFPKLPRVHGSSVKSRA